MNDKTCPICGNDNKCAIAHGEDPYKCWCMNTHFPQKVLDSVPEKYKGKACVCEKCLEKIKEDLD